MTDFLFSKPLLKKIYYHWFWGLSYGEHTDFPSFDDLLFNPNQNPNTEEFIETIRTRQQEIQQYNPVIRFFYWLFNIDNYRRNDYLIFSYQSYQKYQQYCNDKGFAEEELNPVYLERIDSEQTSENVNIVNYFQQKLEAWKQKYMFAEPLIENTEHALTDEDESQTEANHDVELEEITSLRNTVNETVPQLYTHLVNKLNEFFNLGLLTLARALTLNSKVGEDAKIYNMERIFNWVWKDKETLSTYKLTYPETSLINSGFNHIFLFLINKENFLSNATDTKVVFEYILAHKNNLEEAFRNKEDWVEEFIKLNGHEDSNTICLFKNSILKEHLNSIFSLFHGTQIDNSIPTQTKAQIFAKLLPEILHLILALMDYKLANISFQQDCENETSANINLQKVQNKANNLSAAMQIFATNFQLILENYLLSAAVRQATSIYSQLWQEIENNNKEIHSSFKKIAEQLPLVAELEEANEQGYNLAARRGSFFHGNNSHSRSIDVTSPENTENTNLDSPRFGY